MRKYTPLAQMTQEQREKYQAKQKRTKNRVAYKDKEQKRNSTRHQKAWLLSPAVAEPVIIDGEADENGVYWLFQAYSPLIGMRTLKVAPPKRLGLFAVAYFLLDIKKEIRKLHGKKAVFIYFASGYDISQQLYGEKRLKMDEKQAAWGMRSRHWGAVRGPDFSPELLLKEAHKSLYIGRKTGYVSFLNQENVKIIGRVDWQDMFSLSNKSLVATIQDWAKFWTVEQHAEMDSWLEAVKQGKEARGAWTEHGLSKLAVETTYQAPELKLMYWYATTVIGLCASLGLAPRTLAGPAPLARALAHQYGVTAHIKPESYDTAEFQSGPEMDWIRRAYFGGRIENSVTGEVPSFHSYDISSAYPAALQRQPCMAHGRWEKLTAGEVESTNISRATTACTMYEINWRMPEGTVWGPFPVRDPRGGIRYPLEGWGIYHDPEIATFLRLYGDRADYNIVAGYRWIPDCGESEPFCAMVSETYAKRGEYKREGRPEGNVLKLALNSFYGVTAQTHGAYRVTDENGATLEWHTPKLSNTYLAGRITSACRATLMEMIDVAGQENVFSCCTDAIKTFREVALPALEQRWSVNQAGDRNVFPALGSLEHESVEHPTRHFAPGKYAAENGKNKMRGIPSKATYYYEGEPCESLWDATGKALAGTGVFAARFEQYQNPFLAGMVQESYGKFLPVDLTQVCGIMGIQSKRDISRSQLLSIHAVYPACRVKSSSLEERATMVESPSRTEHQPDVPCWYSPPYRKADYRSTPIRRPYDIGGESAPDYPEHITKE